MVDAADIEAAAAAAAALGVNSVFCILASYYDWRHMKVYCPGRYYIHHDQGHNIPPRRLLEQAGINIDRQCVYRHLPLLMEVDDEHKQQQQQQQRRDPVDLYTFVDNTGGLMTYLKADGSFIHTLSTSDGLRRKLAAMGVN